MQFSEIFTHGTLQKSTTTFFIFRQVVIRTQSYSRKAIEFPTRQLAYSVSNLSLIFDNQNNKTATNVAVLRVFIVLKAFIARQIMRNVCRLAAM
jgi:hypothetical protein